MKQNYTKPLFAISIAFILTVVFFNQQTENTNSEISDYSDLSKEELSKIPKYDKPDMAVLFEFEKTKDPALGYPPVERLQEGYSYSKEILAKRRAISNVKWTERGPNNVGGRTRAVMFDPNDPSAKRVFAGGVTGGLWVNEDITKTGQGWTKVNDFLSSLAINNIAYDPNDFNTFYFGTGEGWFGGGMIRGKGVFKSTDAGETWTPLPSTAISDFEYVQKVVVTAESTVLAATRSAAGTGGIYRSTDGGDTWNKVINGRGADIEIVGNKIYASTGIFTTGTLFISENDGVDWSDITPASGAQRIEIGVHPNHNNTVYAVASTGSNIAWFYRSDDSGVNWTQLTVPGYLSQQNCQPGSQDFARGQAWYDLIIGVHPIDSKLVVVGGIDLHRSEDGGETWEPISYWTGSSCEIYVHADQHNFIYRPGFPDQALSTNDGGVFYVSDIKVPKSSGGPVFESRNLDYNVTQFYSAAAENIAGSDYFLAGTQDNGTQQFNSIGVDETFEITGGDGAFCFIDQDDPDIQITSYVFNSYFITTNYWLSQASVGGGNSGLFINPADYNSNTNTLFAAGNPNQILRYKITKGATPSEETLTVDLAGGQITAVTVSPYNDNVVFVGTNSGTIYKLTEVNETPSATRIDNGEMSTNANISCVAIGASEDQLMATATNYGIVSVFETADGGSSWVDKEGNLPDMPVRWAIYNPNNFEEVMVATDLGIWSTDQITSTDVSWEPTNEGLANVRVDMIKYREADGLLTIATHGRGLYTSDAFATTSIAKFKVPQSVGYENAPIAFEDGSVKANSYAWDFGDGNTSTEANPEHTYSSAGTYTVTLVINGDENLSYTETLHILPSLNVNYELADGGDFETDNGHFVAINVAGTGFERGNSQVTAKGGTKSGNNAWVTGLEDDFYAPYSEAYLYTPVYDFTISGPYEISFWTKYQLEDEWEGFQVEYSTDYGQSWQTLGDFLDADNWYNQIAIDFASVFRAGKPLFSGDTGGEYVEKSIVIANLSNNPAVSFRFVFKTDPASEEAGIAIDDFTLTGPTSAETSVSFVIDSDQTCTGESITISNQSSGSIDAYQWDFGANANPPTAVGFGPHSVAYSVGGEKTITLTATTSSGDVTDSQTVSIDDFPLDVEIAPAADTICNNETMEIIILSPQAGIKYALFNTTTGGTQVGDTILSDGTEIKWDAGTTTPRTVKFEAIAVNESGCLTRLSSPLNIRANLAPFVTVEEKPNYVLQSSNLLGDSYQWYKDGVAIDGATETELKVTASGSYAVEVTRDGCATLAEAVEVIVLSLNDPGAISIYPNPAFETVHISLKESGNFQVEIHDMSGRLVQKEKIEGLDAHSFNVQNLQPGLYHLTISSDTEKVTQKIIIK